MPPPIDVIAAKRARGSTTVWKLVNAAIKRAKDCARSRRKHAERTEAQRLAKNEQQRDAYAEKTVAEKKVAQARTAVWAAKPINKAKKQTYTNAYHNQRYAEDENFRRAKLIRSRVLQGLKKEKARKCDTTFGLNGLVGCTRRQMNRHLETTFTEGMTHRNTHVDHIWPLARYDLQDEQQQRNACNWRNTRAAWPAANIAKKNRIPDRTLALTVPRHLWPPGDQHRFC